MGCLEGDTLTPMIYDVLYYLGARATSSDFFYVVHAVRLTIAQPQRSLFAGKWLYPEIAKLYHTDAATVERGIQKFMVRVWRAEPKKVNAFFHTGGKRELTPTQFVVRIASYLMGRTVA